MFEQIVEEFAAALLNNARDVVAAFAPQYGLTVEYRKDTTELVISGEVVGVFAAIGKFALIDGPWKLARYDGRRVKSDGWAAAYLVAMDMPLLPITAGEAGYENPSEYLLDIYEREGVS